jgi:hypothetical protein
VSIELLPDGPNRIAAHIKDAYNAFEMSTRSDGFKRFVTFLLLVSVPARTRQLRNTLFLQDEPDSGLHPSGARFLRDELLKVADSNYVLFSTHSIFMVDRDMVARHLIVEKRRERTSIREAGASNVVDEEVLYNALGYSVFETLKAKNIVFEGWQDKRLFQVSLASRAAGLRQAVNGLRGVGVCHAQGVKDIPRITPILELANRECLIVTDGDQVAREHQRRYAGHGTWMRYDQLVDGGGIETAEDFLDTGYLVGVLNEFVESRPALRALDAAEVTGPGCLRKIKRWLESAGFAGEGLQEELKAVKNRLFSSLAPSQVVGAYDQVLLKMSELLGLT